jgi:hypothetical protein
VQPLIKCACVQSSVDATLGRKRLPQLSILNCSKHFGHICIDSLHTTTFYKCIHSNHQGRVWWDPLLLLEAQPLCNPSNNHKRPALPLPTFWWVCPYRTALNSQTAWGLFPTCSSCVYVQVGQCGGHLRVCTITGAITWPIDNESCDCSPFRLERKTIAPVLDCVQSWCCLCSVVITIKKLCFSSYTSQSL